jgi:RNA polymerase sigma-70 factor (ECF subfamily)
MSFAGAEALEQPLDRDAELVRLAKLRDAAVWSAWHDEHYPVLYRYAYARLRRHEDAEDVAAQVFVEALKGIGRYRYTGRPVLAWFFGIASHLVSRRLRERARLDGLPDNETASSTESVDENARLTRVVLHEALDRLKPEQREVLILRFLVGLPTREVATLLSKSEAATYSLQVRALGAMRRAISPSKAEIFFDPAE